MNSAKLLAGLKILNPSFLGLQVRPGRNGSEKVSRQQTFIFHWIYTRYSENRLGVIQTREKLSRRIAEEDSDISSNLAVGSGTRSGGGGISREEQSPFFFHDKEVMFSVLVSRLVILCLGILYPAYASYKAIRTKSPKDYVKWMMYWVVFSLFLALETVTDIFLAFWFPFYYELKIVIVLWLMMPATRGSSVLYRKFVHPLLVENEEHLDAYIERAKSDSYSVFKEFSGVGLQYLARFVVQATAALQNVAHRSTTALTNPAFAVKSDTAPHAAEPALAHVKKTRSEPAVAGMNDEDTEVLVVEEVPANGRPRRGAAAKKRVVVTDEV
ncbi:putative Receptor expression-enhancing protein 2 [Hypsibius exemplaris]|uniref:Receptor expression-enhancing protein n=1 Tax=Hypsibius exemplaris TaxID=2072580 RepID=A0A1W0WF13_HYPEX|nr:putative Receptor expression-enhancing protein 2 [Hypsibius exemplaris]